MLSYQHAYHAGGPADLHKHLVLAGLLARLTEKVRPISYLETHAGRGLYDLASPAALKTGEAARGIGRLAPGPAHPLSRALVAVRGRHGATAYPGSPSIAATLLRPRDRIVLAELHPVEHDALRRVLGDRAEIHRRDGAEMALALAPLTPRRGLVLVDPSFEIKTEYRATARLVRQLAAKWPEATVMVWYPLLPEARHRGLRDGLEGLPLVIDEVGFVPAPARGMSGSGLALVNPPYGIADVIAAARAEAAPLLTGLAAD